MYIKPYVIQKHISGFTEKGLPLMTVIEEITPKKSGVPHLFKANIEVNGLSVEKCVIKYTKEPNSVIQELKDEWTLNSGFDIEEIQCYELSHGEAALIELSGQICKARTVS